ncbi:MAG: nucleoside triphosphate pyrophosphohydrolase [Chloroflexi bacterium]|nr:nucleoside triphosphate pyrophosphohydrolase [Chloroflexota bacterium]
MVCWQPLPQVRWQRQQSVRLIRAKHTRRHQHSRPAVSVHRSSIPDCLPQLGQIPSLAANGSSERATGRRPRKGLAIADQESAGLTIVGLGPGPAAMLTAAARQLLERAPRVWLRTRRHPTVDELAATARFESFDDVYDSAATLAEVYDTIAARLLALARAPGGCVYAVPGHPLVAEASVRQLLAAAPADLRIDVIPGLSFVDAVATALRLDPFAGGLQLLDGADLVRWAPPERLDEEARWDWLLRLARPPFDPGLPLLLAQVDHPRVVSGIKLVLLDHYPPDHAVTLVRAAGVPGAESVTTVPLFELDRRARVDHLTCIHVPPLDPLQQTRSFAALRYVVARLRGPGGCPWDREQSHNSLKLYLLEEAYEVLDALDDGEPAELAEELGDLLLQILLHAQLASETDAFTMDDVVAGIMTKLIRRHPHVFGDVEVRDSTDVVRNWEQIKRAEKSGAEQPRSALAGVPRQLPSLAFAQAIQRKAARVGFDWPTVDGVLEKVAEEVAEIRRAESPAERQAEIGDLLFALVNLCRWVEVDAEEALRQANRRFTARFQTVEHLASARGDDLRALNIEQLDALWNEAKRQERGD